MSWRRLNNRVHEAVQTDFSDSDSDPTMEGEDANQNVDANGDDPNAFLDDADAADQGVVAEQDPALEAAQAAVDAANNVLAALPPAPQVQQGADPTAVMLANMMHAMQMQNAQTQVHLAQARLDSERQRREDQRRFQIQLEELRRDKGSSNARVRPPQFDLDKDKASFLIWKSRWEFHVKDLDNIRDRVARREKKRAMLQQALSDFTLKWIHNKGFTAENLEDADFLINQLECYIKGTTNPLVQITQLFSLKHDPAQSIESFVTEIKERCRLCEFDKVKSIDNWIPMIVLCCNVAHPDMRKKLLLEKDLTFERAVEICLEEEKALRTSKQLAKSGGDVCVTTANATSAYSQNRSQHQQRQHQQNHGGGQERGRSASRNWRASGSDRSQSQAHHGNAQDVKCYSCGKSGHKSKAPECKATDKTCRNCDKKGHLESVCKAPKRQSAGPQAHNIGVGSLFVTGTECEFEELETIEVTLSTPDGVSIQANALPDTGADISCIAPSTLKLFGLSTKDLQEEHRNPSAANGTALKVLGKIPLTATYRNFFSTEPFFVIENLSRPILSRKCLKRLHLIPQNFPHGVVSATAVSAVESVVRVKTGYPDLDALMARYPRVFDGKCKVMKGKPHHIELEENAKPISSGATRNVAEPYRESLKKELQDLVDQDIIEPVAGASEWLHPIVVVPKKDGGIRMCVDLTKLNKYVKRPVNPQPTPFEVVRKLPKGKKHLAVFDALKGYHQIELDDESRALTTFLTPFGRYRYKRLPFGESDAGDVFTLRYGLAVDSSTEGRRTTEDTLLMGDTEKSFSRPATSTTSH